MHIVYTGVGTGKKTNKSNQEDQNNDNDPLQKTLDS